MERAAPAPSAPRRRDRGRAAALFIKLPCLFLLLLLPGTRGDGFFTGLDDAAQCALARSIAAGAPLVFRDEAFAAVPPEVRPLLLYRPAAARKTRDLAHQIDPATCVARPFYQPFLAWQRVRLPGLPVLLFCAVSLLLGFRFTGALLPPASRRPPGGIRFALLFLLPLAAFPLFWCLTPWPLHFALGPYAEGPATLLAALALALAFHGGAPSDRSTARGFAEGVCLGAAATFHPTLSAYALPIGVFAVLRTGRWRHTLALALGAALGLAPLVLSTLFVCAPYGNFLDPAALRRMVAASPDIRALALALAAALPAGAALLAAAHLPRVRAWAARPRVRRAASALCALALALALAAAAAHPLARRALRFDADGTVFAVLPVLFATALAFADGRLSARFLLAACVAAALPFLLVQGNEVPVGLWSLRRFLAPATLVPLAAFFAAFDAAPAAAPPPRAFHRSRTLLLASVVLFGIAGSLSFGKTFDPAASPAERSVVSFLSSAIAERPEALWLFERVADAAPFAADPRSAVFGLNDRVAGERRHGPVVDWLREEAARRPVRLVASRGAVGPVVERGVVFRPERRLVVPAAAARIDGKTFGTARPVKRDFAATIFSVVPATRENAAATRLAPAAAPWGLEGAWDAPRRGKPGRWAADGAAFRGPIPEPGGAVEIEIEAAWWTRDGTNAPPQRLRLEPPFPGAAAEAVLAPSPHPATLRFTIERDPAAPESAAPESATGLYLLRGAERYDEKGFLPGLVADVRSISARRR